MAGKGKDSTSSCCVLSRISAMLSCSDDSVFAGSKSQHCFFATGVSGTPASLTRHVLCPHTFRQEHSETRTTSSPSSDAASREPAATSARKKGLVEVRAKVPSQGLRWLCL